MPLSGARPERRRGAALLVVLWLAVAAAGLALALLEATRTAVPDGRRAVEAARLRAALHAAVHATADRLLREQLELGGEGARLRLVEDEVELRVAVVAESGLVDLASASPGLLAALARASGLPGGRAEALAGRIEALRAGEAEDRPPAVAAGRGAAEDLRPPARPGLDHPVELRAAAAADAEPAEEAAIERWLALATLGTGRVEPVPELAPPTVRAALAGAPGAAPRPPPAGPATGPAPAAARRGDPANLYRLELVARTPGGRVAVRSVRLALRKGEPRPVRIVDWSAPLVLPDAPAQAEES